MQIGALLPKVVAWEEGESESASDKTAFCLLALSRNGDVDVGCVMIVLQRSAFVCLRSGSKKMVVCQETIKMAR